MKDRIGRDFDWPSVPLLEIYGAEKVDITNRNPLDVPLLHSPPPLRVREHNLLPSDTRSPPPEPTLPPLPSGSPPPIPLGLAPRRWAEYHTALFNSEELPVHHPGMTLPAGGTNDSPRELVFAEANYGSSCQAVLRSRTGDIQAVAPQPSRDGEVDMDMADSDEDQST